VPASTGQHPNPVPGYRKGDGGSDGSPEPLRPIHFDVVLGVRFARPDDPAFVGTGKVDVVFHRDAMGRLFAAHTPMDTHSPIRCAICETPGTCLWLD